MAGGHGAPGHHRLRPGPDRPVAHRATSTARWRRVGASPVASATTARSPSDNGYARPVEGVLATVDAARGIVLDVARPTGSCPCAPDRGSYLPEDNQPLRTDLRPLDITQPDGVSFTLDGNLLTWQGWTMRVSMDPARRSGAPRHRSGTPTVGAVRPILHRAVHQRDGGALRRPGAHARLEERLRRRRVGARAHGQLARPRVRLPRRHHLPRRHLRQRARQALRGGERHLHPRGGLRDPLEAPGHDHRTRRGATVPPPGGVLHRHRRATTSTASSGTSISTGPSSWRSS